MRCPLTFLFSLCFAFFSTGLRAQITNSEESAAWLASKIVSNAGGTAEQYMVYSRNLAKTLSQYSAAQQAEILGQTPPAGGVDTGGGTTDGGGGGTDGGAGAGDGGSGGGGDGGGTDGGGSGPPDPMGLIDDDKLASGDLLLGLLESIPLDEDTLTAALGRTPPMDEGHLTDLLTAQGKVSNGYLVSRLSNSKDNLSSSALKALLIANSPVKSVVLKKVDSTTKMNSADKAAVLAAQ